MTGVLQLSSARGHHDNEDACVVRDHVGVVVDGAGLPKRLRQGCRHPVAWFSHELARRFAGRLLTGEEMRCALAAAIAGTREAHGPGCDLGAGSPSATVAAWRLHPSRGTVEVLSLCDAAALVATGDTVELVVDLRIDDAVPRRAAALIAQEQARGRVVDGERRRELSFAALEQTRNVPGGFWCAHTDPAAAGQALVRELPWGAGTTAIAASDGATRAFLDLGTHTLETFAAACAASPLQEIADAVRRAEHAQAERLRRRGSKVHDDLTLVVARG